MDIARNITREEILLNPDQWKYLSKLFIEMGEYNGLRNNSIGIMGETFIARLLPEYKYGFVFRGLVNKLIGYNNAFNKKDVRIADKARFKKQMNGLNSLNKDNIELNMVLFEDLILFCAKENIPVIILEGQYIPLAYTKKNLELNLIVIKKINELANKYGHVRFIPRSELYQFQVEDYRNNDATHVTKESAIRYTKSFFLYLGTKDF